PRSDGTPTLALARSLATTMVSASTALRSAIAYRLVPTRLWWRLSPFTTMSTSPPPQLSAMMCRLGHWCLTLAEKRYGKGGLQPTARRKQRRRSIESIASIAPIAFIASRNQGRAHEPTQPTQRTQLTQPTQRTQPCAALLATLAIAKQPRCCFRVSNA